MLGPRDVQTGKANYLPSGNSAQTGIRSRDKVVMYTHTAQTGHEEPRVDVNHNSTTRANRGRDEAAEGAPTLCAS